MLDGRLDESALGGERVTPAEVVAARKAGLDGLAGVARATIEGTDGSALCPGSYTRRLCDYVIRMTNGAFTFDVTLP